MVTGKWWITKTMSIKTGYGENRLVTEIHRKLLVTL